MLHILLQRFVSTFARSLRLRIASHVYSCFLLLLLINLPGAGKIYGQQVSVSETISLRKDDFYQILGKAGNYTLVTTDNGYSVELLRFDQKLRIQGRKELELEKRRTQIIDIVKINDQVLVLYQCARRGEQVVKGHWYNVEGQLLDSTTIFTLDPDAGRVDCRIIFSDDQTKALVYYLQKQNQIQAYAMDLKGLKVLWNTQVPLDSYTFFKEFRAILLSNQASMYLILEKEAKRSKQEEHGLEVIQFQPGYVSPLSRSVFLDNLIIHKIRFMYDDVNQALVGTGLYGLHKNERSSGVFLFHIRDNLDESFRINRLPFTEDLVRKISGSSDAFTKGIEDLDLIKVIPRMDGGVVLCAEETKTYVRQTASSQFHFGASAGRSIVDHYHEDILVASIHPNGMMDWAEVFPKKQYSQDDEGVFSSFFLMTAPDKLRIIFNDEVAMENTVSAFAVSPSGGYERSSVLSTDYQKLKLLFREAVQNDVFEVIVPSDRGGKIKLVRIVF